MHHLATPKDPTSGRAVKDFVIVVSSCCLPTLHQFLGEVVLHAVGGVWTNATTEGAVSLELVDMVGMDGLCVT